MLNITVSELKTYLIFIGEGLTLTLQLLLGSLILGTCIGLLLSIARHKNISTGLITKLISVIRGTPLILQLSLIYFSIPSLLGIKLNILTAGIITLGINSSAYISEILRSGLESLPKGQFEAAQTLEIPNYYIWKDIILPQVIRNIFPAMISEIIVITKDTALIATIGGMDIMRRAQTLAAEQFTYFLPLCIAGAYYYLMILLIEHLGKKLKKKKLSYDFH